MEDEMESHHVGGFFCTPLCLAWHVGRNLSRASVHVSATAAYNP